MTKTSKTERRTAVVRTVVPALIGVLLARLIAAVPIITVILEWVDGVIVATAAALAAQGVVGAPLAGITAMWLIQGALTALVIWAYYRIARLLGDRWPAAERWMLGSESRPHYEPQYAAD